MDFAWKECAVFLTLQTLEGAGTRRRDGAALIPCRGHHDPVLPESVGPPAPSCQAAKKPLRAMDQLSDSRVHFPALSVLAPSRCTGTTRCWVEIS